MADLDPITPLIPVPPVTKNRGGKRGRPEPPAEKTGRRPKDSPADRRGVRPDGSVDEYA
jgi:hypothetical protein